MRIFIVGATGVLGRALLPLLLQKGCIVRTFARTPEKVRALELAGVEAVEGDLLSLETAGRLADEMKGCNAVIHIATAIPRDSRDTEAWETTARLRTAGTRSLLQASLSAGARRYIQQSIVMAYPDGGNRWLEEDTPLDTSPARRAISDPVFTMEDMVRDVSPEQLQWCILRGGLFVGPETGQDDLIASLRAGRVTVPCDGRNFLSLVHVVDMARAIVRTLEEPLVVATFNIVDEPIRNGDYLDHLADLLGVPHPPHDLSLPCPPSYRCSNRAARAVLGWTPVHGIWPQS
jgi:nucleoside-diphosphate-sugar epimerase